MATNREKYIDFLKEKVKEWCNEDGCYEVYWDYRDALPPDMLMKAYEEYKETAKDYKQSGNVASFRLFLEDYMFNEGAFEYDEPFFQNVTSEILRSEDVDILTEYGGGSSLKEDLEEAGYNGVDLNISELLRNTYLKVNVMFATDKEADFDTGSIIDTFGSYSYPDLDSVITNAEQGYDYTDNSLTYLIHQQGHTLKEVYNTLYDNPRGFTETNNFVDSVVNEIVNNPSDYTSILTALVELRGDDIISFFENVTKDEEYLVFDTTTEIGLFNHFNGGGSLLEIELEKNFAVPSTMVHGIQIEGASKEYMYGGYSVNEVYGLIGSCWKDCLTYANKAPELVSEDVLQTVRDFAELVNEKEREEEMEIE